MLPRLRRLAGVVTVHSIAGEHDLLVWADADSIQAIGAIRSVLAGLPQIAEVVTLVTLERNIG